MSSSQAMGVRSAAASSVGLLSSRAVSDRPAMVSSARPSAEGLGAPTPSVQGQGFLASVRGLRAQAAAAPSQSQPATSIGSLSLYRQVSAPSTLLTSGGKRSLPPPRLPQARVAPRLSAAGERTTLIGGLRLPVGPPPRPLAARVVESSRLRDAGRHYARVRAAALQGGSDSSMALCADVVRLMDVGESIGEWVDFGVNANTAKKDERAWLFWEHVCEQQGTSPLRTPQEVRERPERQAHLLAALLMYAFAVCVPKNASRHFVKPRSAFAYPLAIIRIFARWGIQMPGYKELTAALHGLFRAYVAYHGPMSLAPRRTEPMKFSMMRAINAIPFGKAVGRFMWRDSDHDIFMFRRLNVFLMYTAFRLGEIVFHASGEIMYLVRASLVWRIGGLVVTDPTPAQLRSLRPGRDSASITPSRSKPDQWGEVHCPFPVTLVYEEGEANPAAALRDIELRLPCHGDDRNAYPLFADASRQPYASGFLHSLLVAVLTHLYGSAVASLYSFHSYRVGLATALHAAGVPGDMIQLICRWMCPESLHVYRRVGLAEHDGNLRRAAKADVSVIQTTNVPRVVGDWGYAELNPSFTDNNGSAERALQEARTLPVAPRGASSQSAPRAPRGAPSQSAPRAPSVVQPGPTPLPCEPLTERPMPGMRVLVPSEVWPSYQCREQGGLGWSAVVKSATAYTAVVAFESARTVDGRPYEDERLAWHVLKKMI